MTFDEYEKLEKRTQKMIFELYKEHCYANKVKKAVSKAWFRWLTEDFNRERKQNEYNI